MRNTRLYTTSTCSIISLCMNDSDSFRLEHRAISGAFLYLLGRETPTQTFPHIQARGKSLQSKLQFARPSMCRMRTMHLCMLPTECSVTIDRPFDNRLSDCDVARRCLPGTCLFVAHSHAPRCVDNPTSRFIFANEQRTNHSGRSATREPIKHDAAVR